MMLSVPVHQPFISFKVPLNDASNIFTTGKDRSRRVRSRASDVRHRVGSGRCWGNSSHKKRRVTVFASVREGAEGLPVKESADKMRLLLKYVKEVQPALIEQFMDLGPPAVVAAMRNTITNTLGTLPPQFFTVTISTVGENMSQLMLSVLMTGYMFRNAQYRLELGNALGTRNSTAASAANAAATATATGAGLAATFVDSSNSSNSRLMQRSQSISVQGTVLDEDTYAPGVQKSRVQGEVLLWHKENGLETLEAVQYIEVLEAEVKRLRLQLDQQQQQPEQLKLAQPATPAQQQPSIPQVAPAVLQPDTRQLPVPFSAAPHAIKAGHTGRSGPAGSLLVLDEPANELLDYLRCLDATSMAELTGSAGPEVSEAMDSFVARLMGTNDRDSLSRAGSDCTAQELAKVMFWLMVVGYTLRGMEVRWDMERAVNAVSRPASGRMGWGSKDTSHETW